MNIIKDFIRGSINVQLTSSLTGVDLNKQIDLLLILTLAKLTNPNQSNKRSAVQ